MKIELKIYQLPYLKLVGIQNVTGWGLARTLNFAKVLFLYNNRICHVATSVKDMMAARQKNI